MYTKEFRQPEIARFEAWLRSHGYQPARDPFVPIYAGFDENDAATDLVGEYLQDRPQERSNQKALMDHAHEIGGIAPLWGDSGFIVMP